MNRNAARMADWTEIDLRLYYGLLPKASRRCPFRQRKDFVPGASITLGEAAPAQLHNTERHEGGAGYVHLSRGMPDLKHSVVAMLDGHAVPYEVMRRVDEKLQRLDETAWLTVNLLRLRSAGQRVEDIADDLGIVRRTIYDRLGRALERLDEYLDEEIEAIFEEVANAGIVPLE